MAIKKAYAQIDDGQVHYRVVAGAGKPIVFLHQTASSSRMWEAVMGRLGTRAMAAFDTPGFGESFDPDHAPSMDDYARWIAAAMSVAGVERAHLVGHHTGAAIAIAIAAMFPERTASLTMIGPNFLTAEERAAFAQRLGAPFRPVRSGAYLLKSWEYLRVGGADAEIGLLHREMVDMLRAWAARPHAYAAVWAQDFQRLYAALNCPTLIMAAHDDVLFPYFERARAARPDVTALALSHGANFEPDLAADEVAHAIAAHVASCD